VATIRKMVDAHGEPIAVEPVYLVVPPELEALADQLFGSINVAVVPDATADATSTVPDGNPYKGKYQPKVVPHLSNSNYTGYSTTAWYLFGRPGDVAAFGIAYLGGIEAPTIESADTDFNTLGFQWRGYLDFGVCQVDHHGAVKSAGA
jgi:phage major head subunit gpT-like protein